MGGAGTAKNSGRYRFRFAQSDIAPVLSCACGNSTKERLKTGAILFTRGTDIVGAPSFSPYRCL
jgi:hypothetical protein